MVKLDVNKRQKERYSMQKQKNNLLEKDLIHLNMHNFECNNIYEYNSSIPKPEFFVPSLSLVI